MAKTRIGLWIALAIAIGVGLVWQFYPLPDAAQRFRDLPLYGKNYIGRNLPLVDFEKEYFRNINVLKRLYQVGDQHLFITALDGTTNRHAVHDPLYCFRGAGWELLSEKRVPMPHGDAMLLELKHEDKIQQALYWFSNGQNEYASPLRYWLEATWRRLTLGHSGPEPVLIMVQPLDKQNLDWTALIQGFPELLKL